MHFSVFRFVFLLLSHDAASVVGQLVAAIIILCYRLCFFKGFIHGLL